MDFVSQEVFELSTDFSSSIGGDTHQGNSFIGEVLINVKKQGDETMIVGSKGKGGLFGNFDFRWAA